MSSLRAVLTVGFAIVIAPVPALACALRAPWDPTDVKQAEVVVTGRLTDYGIVPVRRDRSEKGWSGGHAEFDLTVERALIGEPPRRIRVKWHNSTFSKPAEMADGRYLVALIRPRPGDGETFTVFQRPCSGALLMKSGSAKALAVLRVLEGLPPFPPDPADPPAPPSTEPAPAPTWPAVAGSWPAARGPDQPRIPGVYWIAIGLAGAAFAVALGALVWRRKPGVGDARPDEDAASD